jgi:hypothetical protein
MMVKPVQRPFLNRQIADSLPWQLLVQFLVINNKGQLGQHGVFLLDKNHPMRRV